MAINDEDLFGLSDAARVVPKFEGRRVHTSTLWRWCKRGLRGVRLEYLRIGDRICTSRPALGRFYERLTAQDMDQGESTNAARGPTTGPRSVEQRKRDQARAHNALRRAGI